ncbi:putative serine threonine kinase [Rosellinia necatrix]|uniref:Putative serine threonine kinase n=1 Tax=Rosellinia necatrix TaxID=77044 RepID=A0A1S7UMF8_ROSNE|nr:putative serine threonine kinase [Rosellinia necatrix]
MEICEKGEIFIEKDDDFIFNYTKSILRGTDGEYFYAKTHQRIFRSSIDINGLATTRIPADNVWPLADPEFTRAPDPLPSTSCLKRPSLLYCENDPNNPDYARQILTEVEACEVLRIHPHHNIVQYLGCIVKDGRIRRLGFAKYSITLSQMLKDGTRFNRSRCLRAIEAGVSHMHKLGLVHNDLNPSNIMMDGERYLQSLEDTSGPDER